MKPTSAVSQLLGCVLGLFGLTVLLPGPGSWARLLGEIPPRTQGLVSIGAAAEAAILVIAAAVVWALLVWVLAVWIAAVAGRLPGAPGRCGRAIVRRIAPAAAGRIIAAAVGVSLLAGTSACAVPAMADLGSGASAEVVSPSTIASTPASLGGGAGVVESAASTPPATPTTLTTPTTTVDPADLDDVLSSINIDWPLVAATSPTSGSPAPVDSATPMDSTAHADQPQRSEASPPANTAAPADTTALPTDVAPPTTSAPDSAVGDPADTASSYATPSSTAASDSADESAAVAAAPSTGHNATNPTTTSPSPAVDDPGPDADSPADVTVLPGDTLWSVAQHHLTPDATDQEIDTAWRAWYSANSQVIGDDPDLIQPGQLLLPPDPEMGR